MNHRPQLILTRRDAALARVVAAVGHALRPEDLSRTRVVFTGDLVQSVNGREDRTEHPYTLERGAGFVAAKTTPPNADGIVDLLIPLGVVIPLEDGEGDEEVRDQLIRHLAAHEAVHATIHHLGTEPFDAYKRQELGDATLQFAAMASEQVEEHLAEYLSNRVAMSPVGTTADGVKAAFEALADTLGTQLPAISPDDPDYFRKGMMVSFEALHILWKSLAYLAAELRDGDTFEDVPGEISSLDEWRDHVAPWWEVYTRLLGAIPMSTDIDIPATDRVVRLIGALLQRWALGLGFDLHDTANGSWFRITIWD